jgi:hypothetical protein
MQVAHYGDRERATSVKGFGLHLGTGQFNNKIAPKKSI